MIVEGAKLKKTEPSHPFEFEEAREFQNEVLKWIHEGGEQVAVVNSPTGSGKTAAFSEVCNKKNQTLLIYPTNALLKQQKEVLEDDFDINSEILSGDRLEKHGTERVKEMKGFAEFHTADTILTNPDILQANIQNTYFDLAGEGMEFFNKFDGIVYDEFHFYDDFEASGLLLQIKLITERVPDSKIVLSSATPNKTLAKTAGDVLDTDIRWIESEYAEEGDVFRYDTEVFRNSDSLWDSREEVVQTLEEEVEKQDVNDEPRIALIFNSAYRSNRFYKYLHEENSELADLTEKNNGYDTKQEEEPSPEDHLILVTTKKGEVGLDYDIRLLLMDKPYTAEAFMQRFGRAGRKNEATVHLYQMGNVNWWNDSISYEEFVEQIYSTIDTSQSGEEALKDLMGLRAAHAIHDRERRGGKKDKYGWYSEMYEDFSNVPMYGKWRTLFEEVDEALYEESEGLAWENETPEGAKRMLQFVDECLEVLHSLRGRSVNYDIEYPRGDKTATTTYDLLSVLRSYDIVDADDEKVIVKPKDPDSKTQIRVSFPGYERQSRPWDGTLDSIEHDMREWILDVKLSRLNDDDIPKPLIRNFIQRVGITRSALPHSIAYGNYRFKIERNGIPEVIPEENE